MKRVFADTSYFIALLQEHDDSHQAAVHSALEGRCRLVTSQWVLCELANFFSRSDLRDLFDGVISDIDQSCDVVRAIQDSFQSGLALFRQRNDKNWSLTDRISFNIMTDLGVTEALTADHHFEQAGFTALLKT